MCTVHDILYPLKYALARRKEIETVRSLANNQNGTKLAFQKLPRHMRRRVMSHSIKRVPRVIRQVHLNQLSKSGLPPPQKRPSRKHRRRPSLINSEIARRQRVNKWLETHIWHAKRFHMINRWSYKIPYSSCDKSFRACYRATANHCLLQDISYWGCIELKGSEQYLISAFKKITKPNEGLNIYAKAFINGDRQGESMFYKTDFTRSIGSVLYTWKPNLKTNNNCRTIWLWAHAAYFQELLVQLLQIFNFSEKYDASNNVKHFKSSEIELNDLRFELNRFRLTGPLSQAVLCKALHTANATIAKNWFKTLLDDDEERQLFAEQIEYWKAIKELTPGSLSRNIVFQLIIDDPRLSMPPKRTKALNSVPINAAASLPPKKISAGPMWSEEIRRNVTENRMTTAKLNELRSQLLIPSSDLCEANQQIPILLIQRPGNSKTGFTAGWDIIVPQGWGEHTWRCLIMWGARSGGYRETENINFELGKEIILPPDSTAGMLNESELDLENRRTYFKLPPNKRTNFNKFASVSPLACNWNVLCSDWGCPKGQFIVLRDLELLEKLQACLLNRKRKCSKMQTSYLVPVKITLKSGTMQRYSMICLPTKEDSEDAEIVEPLRSDENFEKRNKLRKEHKKILRRLMKKRHLMRQKGRKTKIDPRLNAEFLKQMKALWLPEVTEGIRTSSSRDVMGFVVKGGVSFRNGCTQGIGYIPLPALKQLIKSRSDNKLLIRNTNSRKYRFAKVDIII